MRKSIITMRAATTADTTTTDIGPARRRSAASAPVRSVIACLIAALLLLTPVCIAAWPGPENVMILVNSRNPESIKTGQHYQEARGIPQQNVCHVDTTTSYAVTMADYEDEIRGPVVDCLHQLGDPDLALFIAVAYGVPGVIEDGGEPVLGKGTRSVDSFLCDPFGEFPSSANPYYHASQPFERQYGFRGYLVTRLDGPSAAYARALVDRAGSKEAQAALTSGLGWFDLEPDGDNPFDRQVIGGAGLIGNSWISQAEAWMSQAGVNTHLDSSNAEFGTAPAELVCTQARWYFGWYSAFTYNDVFEWMPGSIGIHLDSFSAADFRKPGSWCPGAIAAGVTATAGAVWEPYIDGFIEGHEFLKAFAVDRVSLAEAAWRAIPKVRWMMVVFGDPLFALDREYPLNPDIDQTEAVEAVVEESEDVTTADGSTTEHPQSDLRDSGPADTGTQQSDNLDSDLSAVEQSASKPGSRSNCAAAPDARADAPLFYVFLLGAALILLLLRRTSGPRV